ncbi:MAG: hypothetical protein AAF518_20065 [Spirochaetota bacterium]
MIHKLLLITCILLLAFCQKGNYDQTERDYVLSSLVLQTATSSTSTTSSSCSTTVSFATLQASSFNSNCARCHASGQAQGSLMDANDYSSVVSKVTPGNSNDSLLYTKITTGSMTQYANDEIRTLVQCWIDTGANP